MTPRGDKNDLAQLCETAAGLDPVDDAPEIEDLYHRACELVDAVVEPLKGASIHAHFAPLLGDLNSAIAAYYQAVQAFAVADDADLSQHAVTLARQAADLRLAQPGLDIEQAIRELWVWLDYDRDLMLPLADLYGRRVEGEPLDNWRTRISLLETRLGEIDFRREPNVWASCNDEVAVAHTQEPDGDFQVASRRRVERHRVSLEILGDYVGLGRVMCHVRLTEALFRVLPESPAERHAFEAEALRHAQTAHELTTGDIDPDVVRMAAQNLTTAALLRSDLDLADIPELLKQLRVARSLVDPTTHPTSTANVLKASALLRERWLGSKDADPTNLEMLLAETQEALELLGDHAPDERYVLHGLRGRALTGADRTTEALSDCQAAFEIAHSRLAASQSRAARLEAARWVGATSGTVAHLHLVANDIDKAMAALERGRTQLRWVAPHHYRQGAVDPPSLVAAGSVMIMTCFAADPGWAIVTTAQDVTVVALPELSADDLASLVGGDDRDNQLGGWMLGYAIQKSPDPHTRQIFLDTIESVAAELATRFWAPVHAELERLGIEPGSEVVLLAEGASAALPFNASALELDGQLTYVIDHYALRYAPNIRGMEQQEQRVNRDSPPSARVIADPRNNLDFEDLEGLAVSRHTPATELIRGEHATADALLDALATADIVHVSAHAEHDVSNVWASSLQLANHVDLTLDQLVNALAKFDCTPELVFLASCESGTPRVTSHANELLGFPTALLEGGASTVIGAQWCADDMAAALLALRFYDVLSEGVSAAEALRQAQMWLRDSTGKELRRVLANIGKEHPNVRAIAGKLRLAIRALGDGPHPFAHPWNWAALVVHGG